MKPAQADLKRGQAVWRSRRGLLELDLLLLPFASHEYDSLSVELKSRYQELLLLDDVVLLDWFRDSAKCDAKFKALIDQVIRFSESSS